MSKAWNHIKAGIWWLHLPNVPACVHCGANATELAHAIRHKRYSKAKHHKYIDVEENATPICTDCQKVSETDAGRRRAWEWLCKKYGRDHMHQWHDGLPFTIKDTYD